MSSKSLVILSCALIFTAGCGNQNSDQVPPKTGISEEAEDLNAPEKLDHIRCAQETCGLAMDLPFFTAPHQAIDTQLFDQYVSAQLYQFIDLEVSTLKFQKQIFSDFSKIFVDKISDNYLAFINLMYFSSLSKVISPHLKIKNGEMVVNTVALRNALANLKTLSNDDMNWILNVAKMFFESKVFYENYNLSLYPLEIFVQKAYPGTDLLTGIALEAQKLEQIQQRFAQIFPVYGAYNVSMSQIFDKAKKKEPLTPDEKKEFGETRMSLLSIQEILPNGSWRNKLLNRPKSIKAIAEELLKIAKENSEEKFDDSQVISEKEKLIKTCNFALISNIASSPTPEQNQRFFQTIQNLKSDAKLVIGKSRYNSLAINQAINKVEVMLPPTKQQTAAALSRTLKFEIQGKTAILSKVKQLDPSRQEDKEVALMLIASSMSDDEDDKEDLLLDDTAKFCKENSPEQISDASYSIYQLINVGWRSVLYSQFGYGIASHELGHVISAADRLSSETYFRRVKSCLVLNKKGVEDFVEEDFADLFATQMMKSAPHQQLPQQSNYSCLLLSHDEKGEYNKLKMTADPDDSHSTGFYRLLAIGTQLNSLTPTCEAAKQASPHGQRMKNCWGL